MTNAERTVRHSHRPSNEGKQHIHCPRGRTTRVLFLGGKNNTRVVLYLKNNTRVVLALEEQHACCSCLPRTTRVLFLHRKNNTRVVLEHTPCIPPCTQRYACIEHPCVGTHPQQHQEFKPTNTDAIIQVFSLQKRIDNAISWNHVHRNLVVREHYPPWRKTHCLWQQPMKEGVPVDLGRGMSRRTTCVLFFAHRYSYCPSPTTATCQDRGTTCMLFFCTKNNTRVVLVPKEQHACCSAGLLLSMSMPSSKEPVGVTFT